MSAHPRSVGGRVFLACSLSCKSWPGLVGSVLSPALPCHRKSGKLKTYKKQRNTVKRRHPPTAQGTLGAGASDPGDLGVCPVRPGHLRAPGCGQRLGGSLPSPPWRALPVRTACHVSGHMIPNRIFRLHQATWGQTATPEGVEDETDAHDGSSRASPSAS